MGLNCQTDFFVDSNEERACWVGLIESHRKFFNRQDSVKVLIFSVISSKKNDVAISIIDKNCLSWKGASGKLENVLFTDRMFDVCLQDLNQGLFDEIDRFNLDFEK